MVWRNLFNTSLLSYGFRVVIACLISPYSDLDYYFVFFSSSDLMFSFFSCNYDFSFAYEAAFCSISLYLQSKTR